MDKRFYFEKKFFVKEWAELIIPTAIAPPIQISISSGAFYKEAELMANNKYQKFIFEGKYK